MVDRKAPEKFFHFALEQYKTETRLWVYLFLALAVIFGISNLLTEWPLMVPIAPLYENKFLSTFAISAGVFLMLCALRLVSLFLWYIIIFWLLRWFPAIRREKFSTQSR